MPHVDQWLDAPGATARALDAHARHAAGSTGFGAAEACLPGAGADPAPARNAMQLPSREMLPWKQP
jgi:hypothetical protein